MMQECKVTEPIWHGGEQVKAGAVVSLPFVDAVYLRGIGRVEFIEPEAEAEPEAKPARKARKTNAD